MMRLPPFRWMEPRTASEAVEILNKDGLSVKGFHLSQLWPFPDQHLLDNFKGVKRWGIVEGNYTGQLARLIQMGATYQQIPEWDFDSTALDKAKITAEDQVEAFKNGLYFIQLENENTKITKRIVVQH